MSWQWAKNAVIYQIYPRSFYSTTDSGIGTLAGIEEKLGYVADLGVDAIWLSPFFQSPMKDMGYDVSNYTDVDPIFGTLQDFDSLLTSAKHYGLKVLIDQIPSHCSDQHPWFIESRACSKNAKADWFVWAEAKEDGSPPNNWLSVFGGSAWSWEPRRRQYYLHNFFETQPDLNLHNPQVRTAILASLEFWLQRGVDGFRLDAINFCMHDLKLRNNPARAQADSQFLSGAGNITPYGMQQHLFNHTQEGNLQWMEEIRQLLDRYQAFSIGEIGSDNALQVMADYTTSNRLHSAYSFDLLVSDYSAAYISSVLKRLYSKMDYPCVSIGNHDVMRVCSRWSGGAPTREKAKIFILFLMCLKGPVCLYQGDELGLPEAEVPFSALQDDYGKRFWPEYKGRDGCRTPIAWQKATKFAGFSSTQPWLPIDDAHLGLAVDQQQQDKQSVYHFTRACLAWRKQQPAIMLGDICVHESNDYIHWCRQSSEQKVYCYFNLSHQALVIKTDTAMQALNMPVAFHSGQLEGSTLTLPPYSACLAVA